MTKQEIEDAFILWLSGATEMKDEKEFWYIDEDNDTLNKKITLSFPYSTASYCIIRGYRQKSKKIYMHQIYRDGILHITTCYRFDGSIWQIIKDSNVLKYESFGQWMPEYE
ncbi:MAG: hypothetical protein WC523_04460 [Patescibacteria group bacterium]